MSVNLAHEPGWQRIGRICSSGRRSLWLREAPDGTIEVCGGREGDDLYLRVEHGQQVSWEDFTDVIAMLRFAAEHEDPDGLTLEREASAKIVAG